MVETPEPRKAGINPPAHGTRGEGAGAHYVRRLNRISHGSASRAAVTSRNSMISRRRSPPSFRHERLRTTKLLSHLRLRQPFDIAQ